MHTTVVNCFTWQGYPGRRSPWLKHFRDPPSLITQNPGFTRHASLKHSSQGRHVNGVPEQTPFEHRSLLVQAWLSVHGKASLFVQACLLALLQSCWIVIYLDVKLFFEINIWLILLCCPLLSHRPHLAVVYSFTQYYEIFPYFSWFLSNSTFLLFRLPPLAQYSLPFKSQSPLLWPISKN